jgi:DNA-binding LacI/PurR family transcriptional regulator
MSKRISLSDVAQKTGFSVPTVSLALRDVPVVAHETRRKVQEAARSLGYRPNPLLAALASKHFGSNRMSGIPLVYLDSGEGPEAPTDAFRHLLGTAQEYARKLGYFFEFFHIKDFKDGSQATRILSSRGVQGIIVRHDFQPEMFPEMDWARFSVVGFGESAVESPVSPMSLLHRSAVDHFGQTLRAWNETFKRGYRKIGFAFFKLSLDSMDDQSRWSAAQLCRRRVIRRFRVPPFILDATAEGSPSQQFRTWFDRHRPDAIIGFNAYFLHLLKIENIRIPQDVGFAALHVFDQTESASAAAWFNEAGMKDMRQESLFAAVELMDQQIRHHQYGFPPKRRTLTIHSEWIDGETLPIKNAALHGARPT